MIERHGSKYLVSTLENPVWYLCGYETLNLIFRYKEGFVWFSIAERNSYCDRGHYRVTIEEGDHLLDIDAQDDRPNYYMSLLNAIWETTAFARWRCNKQRAENYPQLRTGSPSSWSLLNPDQKGLLHAHEVRSMNMQELAQYIVANHRG